MNFRIVNAGNSLGYGKLRFNLTNENNIFSEFSELAVELCKRARETKVFEAYDLIQKELDAITKSNNELTICVLNTIIKFSDELGYPVAFSGYEGGTILFQLLTNKNNIYASNYSTDKFVSDLEKGDLVFDISLAKLVKERIINVLNIVYNDLPSDTDAVVNINISKNSALEQISKLSDKTHFDYRRINPQDEIQAINVLYKELFTEMFGEEPIENSYDFDQLVRLYAYEKCSSIYPLKAFFFSDIAHLSLRDDIYDKLVFYGIEKERALYYSNEGVWENNRDESLSELGKTNAAQLYKFVCKNLSNTWSKSSVVSRVENEIILKVYELN